MSLRRIGTRARSWGVAGAFGLVLAVWPAAANGAPFDLAWSAPDGCPSRQEIVDATQARLRESRSEAPPSLFVQGTVVPASGGFVVTLVLKDEGGRAVGERVVRVERQSCSEVLRPASLVLAMMIAVARPRVEGRDEPRAASEPPEPAHASLPPALPPPEPAGARPRSARPRSPESPSPEPPPHRLSVGAASVGSLGVLPGTGLGFALRAHYLPRSIALVGLEGSFEAGGSRSAGGGEIGFQLLAAGVRVGLPVLRAGRVELIPTVAGRVGLIRTFPTGFAVVQNDTRTTTLVGLGVLVRAKIMPSLFVEALPEVGRVLLRDRLQILDGDRLYRVHQPSPFEGRLSLGLGYEFL